MTAGSHQARRCLTAWGRGTDGDEASQPTLDTRSVMSTDPLFPRSRRAAFCRRLVLWGVAMLVGAMTVAAAQQPYKTAEDAAEALVSAVRTGDRSAILTVLGR